MLDSQKISHRKHLEKILHQREQEFRALVEHSPDIITRFDRQMRHVYVNPAVELATGIRREEFLGKTHRELGMPPELLSLWEASIQTIFQTGEPDEHEFSFLTPQGWRYYQSRLFPELGGDGSVEFVLAICRDLTQHKQTEEALQKSEERFRSVFELAPLGIIICNAQGRLLQSNQAFQELLGYTEPELQNLTFIEFTYPDDQAESLKLFQALLVGTCHHFTLEKRYVRKDGGLVWVNLSVSGIYDGNGLFQYAIAMLQNISEHKQAELELQQAHAELEKRVAERTAELAQANTRLRQEIAERTLAQQELKAQKDFLQTVLDTNPNLIFVKDREGKITLANQAYADFWGTTIEDLLGKTDTDFNPNLVEVESFQHQGQEVSTPLVQMFIPEEAYRLPTGEVRWFQTLKKPIVSAEKQICQFLGVSTDITQHKLAESQIQTSLREKEVLLQEIHHRVKNNLQVVSSLLDLQSQYIDEPRMLEIFRESQNRIKSMALIHEQLYQSKDCAKINLSNYIQELTSYLRRVYGMQAAQIKLELDIKEVALNINTAIPCGLIISELVSNAMKYAFPPEKGGIIKIFLDSESDNCLKLIIKDNGVGLPFHPDFKSIKSLGLQLVTILIQQMEGNLEINCSNGTEFKIHFPLG